MEDNEYLKHLSIAGKWSPELKKKYVLANKEILKQPLGKKEVETKPKSLFSNEDEFIKAAFEGDLKTLLNLKSKVAIDTHNSKGQTALISSVIGGKVSAVRFLLAKQANSDIFDETGNAALHYSCLKEDLSVLQVLLEKVSPNFKNQAGETILHLAIKNEKYSSLDFLLNSTKININEQDKNGNTVVHIAIMERNVKVLMKLMHLTVDLSLYNKEGMNPINFSIYRDEIECLKLLLSTDHGLKMLVHKTLFNETNFQMAVRCKFTAIVNYLLNLKDCRIITSELDDKYGFTCLHWATLQMNKDLIERILNVNQKLINIKDATHKTVLDHIVNLHENAKDCQTLIMDIAIKLIERGADIDLVENRLGLQKIIRVIFLTRVKS